MTGEASGIRKRFLVMPKVPCAGWVGTIKHHTVVQWLKGKKKEQKRGTRAVAGRVQF